MKKSHLCVLLVGMLAAPLFGQQKTFNWVPGNDETVSLDPGYYHAGPALQPGSRTSDVRVEIDSQQPVTVSMATAQDWNNFAQRPDAIGYLKQICVQQHIAKATYTCTPPPGVPMVTVIRDERPSRESYFGFGRVIDHHDRRDGDHDRDRDAAAVAVFSGRPVRDLVAPNNVRVQYFDWACTDYCNQPDPPQPKLFNWVPASDETVRLDPDNYYSSRTYNPGPNGSMQVEIEARYPITIAMVEANSWNDATQRPTAQKNINSINYSCVQRHAVTTHYTCNVGIFWPQVLVIRDEREPRHDRDEHDHDARRPDNDRDHGQFRNPAAPNAIPAAVAGASMSGNFYGRHFDAPNDVHIQYYSWKCVLACDQPDFGWVRQVKEKYPLTAVMKIYSGLRADHDGAQVSIKVKSPVPMAVAVLPSSVAGQLYGKPEMFESAVANSSCQQRGVQSSTFQCTLNVADGPQSLVLLPEAGSTIPKKKKAEVEMQTVKCVNNCNNLPGER